LVGQEHAKECIVDKEAGGIDTIPDISEVLKSSSPQLNSFDINEVSKENIADDDADVGPLFVGVESHDKNLNFISSFERNWNVWF
jgi:hypothetical protein